MSTTIDHPMSAAVAARTLRRRTALLLATLLAVVLVAAACSDNGDDASTDDPPTATQPDAGGPYGGGESDATEPDEPAGPADGATVEATGFQFQPDTLEVEVGTEVTWNNGDDVGHTVTADDGEFDIEIGGGASGSHTFDEPGAHAYACSIHPSMTGTVEVG